MGHHEESAGRAVRTARPPPLVEQGESRAPKRIRLIRIQIDHYLLDAPPGFRGANGHTIARHRMRLRVRAALERLAQGEHDLARLAADVGSPIRATLCRVVRAETRRVPSAPREAISC